MKKLILATALAAIVATPAMAQTARRAPQALIQSEAQAYGRSDTQRRMVQPNTVYEGGTYVGADPDPNVRLNLRMDYEHRDF